MSAASTPTTATHYPTLIGVVAVLLWAALALLTVQARGLPPFELLTLSFGVAFLAGLVMLAVRGRPGLAELRPWPAAWLTAFGGLFLFHALYFVALANAPPAQASLIAYLWPLLIVLLSAALLGQHLRMQHVLGAVLGLAGTAIIVLQGNAAGVTAEAVPGYLAACGCALAWSGYSVLNRRHAGTPSGMLVGVCGAVALAGAACHAAFEPTIWPDGRQAMAAVALGVGPTGLAFLAWDHATKHGNLPALGALSYMAPLLSTLLLVLAGQAAVSWQLAAACVLVVAGSVVATG